MQMKQSRVHTKRAKYRVELHVRISKEKTQFAKGAEQNYTTEIFRFIKTIHSTPRPVYELEDLKQKVIDGQFYKDELTPVRITKHTTFEIDKILAISETMH